MAVFIYLSTSKHGASVPNVLVNTVVLVAFFAPFSYFVDSITYRIWTKRTAKR
jgi:hypothetical protein